MRHYPVEKKFEQILTLAGLPVKEVLQRANLSLELFNSENPVLTTEEYFNFMKAIESFSVSDELVLQLSTADSIETFSPPAFAAYCSRMLSTVFCEWQSMKPYSVALILTSKKPTIRSALRSRLWIRS